MILCKGEFSVVKHVTPQFQNSSLIFISAGVSPKEAIENTVRLFGGIFCRFLSFPWNHDGLKISRQHISRQHDLGPLLIHVFQFSGAGSGIAALICDWITALSY
jgi:hypothetical protein